MIILGQITSTSNPERLVGSLAILTLIGVAVWRVVKWISRTEVKADPWDETVAAEVARDDAVPLCHHCLSPHDPATDFCPDCGAPVGRYTNWLPYPQLFAIGYVLRTGTSGEFKRSPITLLGFILFALTEYALFVPVYWILFVRRIFRPRPRENPPPSSTTIQ
jgi:hypothetical protein